MPIVIKTNDDIREDYKVQCRYTEEIILVKGQKNVKIADLHKFVCKNWS